MREHTTSKSGWKTRKDTGLICENTLGKESEWGYLRVGRIADIAVLDYTDEGFDLTDKAENHIGSQKGYRCVLTVSDGQVVYRN